jgi:S-DNA-T family DNA segregation ATPase FtsK/SpoIIIE
MREILESEVWNDEKRELPIALGKDVSGKPLISDLTKMPHLLIAGATGSGKSVCINSIVASILYSKSPKDVRLIMVDPKVVELKVFNPLPHMLIPVVTEPKKVPAALKWLLKRDGAALPGVRQGERPQHPRLQQPQEGRKPDPCGGSPEQQAGVDGATEGIEVPSACPTSSPSSTSSPTS